MMNEPKSHKKSWQSRDIAEVYNEIAESFNQKRSRPWCEVVQFIKDLSPSEQLVLDLGCGNGRHSLAFMERGFNIIGTDISFKVLEIAKTKAGKITAQKNASFINADGTNLPFRKNAFYSIIAIAVIHHLKTKAKRKQLLLEIFDKLDKNGLAFISCWLRTHPRFEKKDLRKEILEGKKEVLVPWVLSGREKIFRYYYLFDPQELKQLCEEVGFQIEKYEIVNHNLFLTLRKV